MNPPDEATSILSNVVAELNSADRDIVLVLRRCLHACQLLSWSDELDWFKRELGGYPASFELPSHRRIQGKLIWRASGSVYEKLRRATEETVYGVEDAEAEEEAAPLDVSAGVDFLLKVAQSGYTETTGETKEGWSPRRERSIKLERVRVFSAASFEQALSEIERMVFEFASRSYSVLRYGNALGDIWSDYRTAVDEALNHLGFGAHLDAIQSGLQSDNPEAWRAAVLECRNLLNDLANHLWQDPRATYLHLQGDGQGGRLNVQQDRFANRLAAYLHQKGLRGKGVSSS